MLIWLHFLSAKNRQQNFYATMSQKQQLRGIFEVFIKK